MGGELLADPVAEGRQLISQAAEQGLVMRAPLIKLALQDDSDPSQPTWVAKGLRERLGLSQSR